MEFEFNGDILPDEYAEIMRYYGYKNNICPGDIHTLLDKASGEDIILHIDSDGGSLIAGTEIYSLLRGYSGHKKAHIRSRAASSATVAIMACDEITAENVSLVCVHNPTMYSSGDAGVMRHTAEELDNVKEAIIAAYSTRIKSKEEISELMNRDIWLNAEKALEYGLIDSIEENKGHIINSAGRDIFPTEKMIAEYREIKNSRAREKAILEILTI